MYIVDDHSGLFDLYKCKLMCMLWIICAYERIRTTEVHKFTTQDDVYVSNVC